MQDQLVRALDAAVTATEAGEDIAVQMRAHRWAWLQPALLVPAARKTRTAAEGDEADENTYNTATLATIRRRLEQAERGDQSALLHEHCVRLQRERKRAEQGDKPERAGEEEPEAWAR